MPRFQVSENSAADIFVEIWRQLPQDKRDATLADLDLAAFEHEDGDASQMLTVLLSADRIVKEDLLKA